MAHLGLDLLSCRALEDGHVNVAHRHHVAHQDGPETAGELRGRQRLALLEEVRQAAVPVWIGNLQPRQLALARVALAGLVQYSSMESPSRKPARTTLVSAVSARLSSRHQRGGRP